MTEQFGLKEDAIEQIGAALSAFRSIRVAVLYGSRAKGDYRPGSDIDLTLKTQGNVPDRMLMQVMLALDNLDLAYSFELSIFAQIEDADLIDHIRRVGVEFYNAAHHRTR